MIHRINAIGGDLHLEERRVAFADEPFNRDAGMRQIFGQTCVVDVERDELAEPIGRNTHLVNYSTAILNEHSRQTFMSVILSRVFGEGPPAMIRTELHFPGSFNEKPRPKSRDSATKSDTSREVLRRKHGSG